jgi:hypothetical protein
MILLVALLVTFAVSSVPAFAAFTTVRANEKCYCVCPFGKCRGVGCKFDNTTGQCINAGCLGSCQPEFSLPQVGLHTLLVFSS